MASILPTSEEIFKDYSMRRIAIIRALTRDVDQLYGLCDPDKGNLCLYGHPNNVWEVTMLSKEVPSEFPHPAFAINLVRNEMSRSDWISMVAGYSDSWLLSVAFCFGTRLSHIERKRLFDSINILPTISQVVTGNKPITGSIEVVAVENEHIQIDCGSCGGNYNKDEFWIGCDVCERWYHGKCVMMNPIEAETLKHYECPLCSSNRRGMP